MPHHPAGKCRALLPAEAWNLFFGVTGRDEDYDESGHGLIRDETLDPADRPAFPGGLPVTPPRPVLDIANYEDIELLAILARLDYQITPNATAGFGYRWEDYTIDSFILQGLQNYLPGAILLNPDLGDYQGERLPAGAEAGVLRDFTGRVRRARGDDIPPAHPRKVDLRNFRKRWRSEAGNWWSRRESNPRPLECHSSALPTELRPQSQGGIV